MATAGDTRWRWIQADEFAGKTALLACFALHPPESVDVAACFLQATLGDNTATHALTMLNQQLAALAAPDAPYLVPTEPSDLAFDFTDLLHAAAAASRQQERRLLILVDGLDEYSPEDPRRLDSWLPDQATLPDGVTVLVASRAGIRIPLPDQHPSRPTWRRWRRPLEPPSSNGKLKGNSPTRCGSQSNTTRMQPLQLAGPRPVQTAGRLDSDHRLTRAMDPQQPLQPADALTRHRQRHRVLKQASPVADPDPVHHLARIHRDDHCRGLKSNPQDRHEPPPPTGLPTQSSQVGSRPIS